MRTIKAPERYAIVRLYKQYASEYHVTSDTHLLVIKFPKNPLGVLVRRPDGRAMQINIAHIAPSLVINPSNVRYKTFLNEMNLAMERECETNTDFAAIVAALYTTVKTVGLPMPTVQPVPTGTFEDEMLYGILLELRKITNMLQRIVPQH